MAQTAAHLKSIDPVWDEMVRQAQSALEQEPLLGAMIHSSILHHSSLEQALSYRIALKLASAEMPEQMLREIADHTIRSEELGAYSRADLMAVRERDPACHNLTQPLLFFKGFQAIQAYRVGHALWRDGRKDLAYFFQSRISEVFGIDIHPAAVIGRGLMIDHAHSIVIGETAVVGEMFRCCIR